MSTLLNFNAPKDPSAHTGENGATTNKKLENKAKVEMKIHSDSAMCSAEESSDNGHNLEVAHYQLKTFRIFPVLPQTHNGQSFDRRS